MAKRRLRSADERPADELTPEERRERRREERRKDGKGKRPKTPATGWRRAVVPIIAVGAILAVAILVLYGTNVLFPAPCLQFQPIPSGSGTPAFPAANTTASGFATSWCPGDAPVFQTYPRLTIVVGGSAVAIPTSIGISSNFSSYTCTLPIHTQVPTSALPSGTISIESAWPYEYTLGEFFQVWQGSYVSAYVNSSYSTRTIDYTSTSLLGLPADSTHSLTLFVDNQPSSEGPNLVLNTLDGSGSTYPSCLSKNFGTGHTIELVYHSTSTTAIEGGIRGAALSTAGLPLADGAPLGAAMPRVVLTPVVALTLAHQAMSGLTWLGMRVVA